jgi:hypothetical protein
MVRDHGPLRVQNRGDVLQGEKLAGHVLQPGGKPENEFALPGRGNGRGFGAQQFLVDWRGVAEIAFAVGGLAAGVEGLQVRGFGRG